MIRSDGASWLISSGGTGNWKVLQSTTEPLENVKFGDFDGDGKADVMRAYGDVWEVSYGGTEPFEVLNTATLTIYELLLGDFDGNGVTDVFITSEGYWWYYAVGQGFPFG